MPRVLKVIGWFCIVSALLGGPASLYLLGVAVHDTRLAVARAEFLDAWAKLPVEIAGEIPNINRENEVNASLERWNKHGVAKFGTPEGDADWKLTDYWIESDKKWGWPDWPVCVGLIASMLVSIGFGGLLVAVGESIHTLRELSGCLKVLASFAPTKDAATGLSKSAD